MRSGDPKEDLVMMLAVLCHTFSESEILSFFSRLSGDKTLLERVKALVRYHDEPMRCYLQDADNPQIRRLALKVPLDELVVIAKAIHLGKTTPEAKEGVFLAGDWLLQRASQANATEAFLQPLLQGRDLIDQGYTPSPDFKIILDTAYEAQLDGVFDNRDGALEWLRAYRS
jgi:tRNA nucleotidyltransferase (CCA-adding enzyme)